MATEAPPIAAGLEAQSSVVHGGCSWEQYLAIEAFLFPQGIRVRYLNGYLEIMAPISSEHERRKCHLGRLVDQWCLSTNIRAFANGSTTLKEDEKAGGEPDESFFFHEEKDRPDLVIEVALTSGGLSKRRFYATFGVPEIWIWRDSSLEVHVLGDDGVYNPSEVSTQLPGIPLDLVERCAAITSTTEAIREFQQGLGAPPKHTAE